MDIFIYCCVNSAILLLMACGFTLVFGVSRVANFAHGSIYILCGFMTWSFLNGLGLPYWLSVILSIFIIGLFGAVIYNILFVRVRGMPISEIIVSLALGIGILEGLRLQGIGSFKGFIGPGYILPVLVDRMLIVKGTMIDAQRLFILCIAIALIIAMWVFTRFTKTGLAMRAIAQKERVALMLGIDSDRAATLSLGIGSALAGLASIVLLPLSQVTAEAGYEVLINAVAVCIIGGLGSWGGGHTGVNWPRIYHNTH